MSEPTEYTLTKGAALFVASVVSNPGWAKTIEDIYLGGSLLMGPLSIEPPADRNDAAFYDEQTKFSLVERERDCIKRAVSELAKQGGKLPVSKYSYEAIHTLKLV